MPSQLSLYDQLEVRLEEKLRRELGAAVLDALRQWQFRPARQNGQLAEVEVQAKQVERVCKRIGAERVDQRNEAVKTYEALPLTERNSP